MKFLEVHIWNHLVGILSYNKNTNETSFEYSKEFLRTPIELSPLIQPKRVGVFVYSNINGSSFKGLPEFIADSLPDKFGNDVLDEYLQLQGINSNSLNPLEKLAYRGNRAMGALEFYPSKVKSNNGNVDLQVLNDLSNRIIQNKPIGTIDNGLVQLVEYGTSPGGAQPKILINIDQNGNIVRGDNPLEKGENSYILKFNSKDGEFNEDKGKIEYLYYLLAKEAGIVVSDSKLIQIGEEQAFMTKRFDRVNGEKIHMQTIMNFAKMDWKNPVYGYDDLFKVLQFLNNGQKEKQELFKRMVFNVITKNVDDHTKNFSFVMNKQGEWKLSPSYDVLFTAKYGFRPHKDNHFLTINGKHNNFIREDLLSLAKSFSIKKPNQIIDNINNVIDAFMSKGETLEIKKEHLVFIHSKFNRLK